VKVPCSSDHRCAKIACTPCSKRAASRLSRRIVHTGCRNFIAIEIDAAIASTADFRKWRIEARNILDCRRRESRWWRDTGLWVWRQNCGQVRGIIGLGSVLSNEFMEAFDRRWPTTLRSIAASDLKSEIVGAILPGIYAGPVAGRYQALKLSVWPESPRGRCPPR
jgi:hypothetical protein